MANHFKVIQTNTLHPGLDCPDIFVNNRSRNAKALSTD